MIVNFTLNGKKVQLDIPPMMRLLDLLREELHLTGTKEGCGEGECGACTVLIDGKAVCSCLIPAVQIDGSEILTVEGLEKGDLLHPVQEVFAREGAVQCGICTPGFLLTTYELYNRGEKLSQPEIREALAGNLCRCTGYQKIIEAVEKVLNR